MHLNSDIPSASKHLKCFECYFFIPVLVLSLHLIQNVPIEHVFFLYFQLKFCTRHIFHLLHACYFSVYFPHPLQIWYANKLKFTPLPALVLKLIKLPTSHGIYFVLIWSLSLLNFAMFQYLHASISIPAHLLCVLKDSGFYVITD
jgi:hypothetical protein